MAQRVLLGPEAQLKGLRGCGGGASAGVAESAQRAKQGAAGAAASSSGGERQRRRHRAACLGEGEAEAGGRGPAAAQADLEERARNPARGSGARGARVEPRSLLSATHPRPLALQHTQATSLSITHLGALEATYIRSAVRLNDSTRARLMYDCSSTLALPALVSGPPRTSNGHASLHTRATGGARSCAQAAATGRAAPGPLPAGRGAQGPKPTVWIARAHTWPGRPALGAPRPAPPGFQTLCGWVGGWTGGWVGRGGVLVSALASSNSAGGAWRTGPLREGHGEVGAPPTPTPRSPDDSATMDSTSASPMWGRRRSLKSVMERCAM